jgi:hypothetical protein
VAGLLPATHIVANSIQQLNEPWLPFLLGGQIAALRGPWPRSIRDLRQIAFHGSPSHAATVGERDISILHWLDRDASGNGTDAYPGG